MKSNIVSDEIVWQPSAALIKSSRMHVFMQEHSIDSYDELLAKSDKDPGWFWDAVVKFQDYDKVMDDSKGAAWTQWCVGGKTNVVLNCLDKRLGTSAENNLAIMWESETGDVVKWTFAELNHATCQFAEGLRSLEIGKGDVVGLYMPMIPDAVVALLAVAKVGGIVLPLFSGFAAPAIISRLNDAQAVAVIAADGTWRRGNKAGLKQNIDEAADDIPSLRHVIVKKHLDEPIEWTPDRDQWWHELCANRDGESPTEIMDAEDPFMLVYTSGTTGKPKGTVHTHCGFPIKIAACDLGLCFDLKENDRMLFFSDMGWLAGPMLAYGALMQSACNSCRRCAQLSRSGSTLALNRAIGSDSFRDSSDYYSYVYEGGWR